MPRRFATSATRLACSTGSATVASTSPISSAAAALPAALARSWRSPIRRSTKSITGIALFTSLGQTERIRSNQVVWILRLRQLHDPQSCRSGSHGALLPTIRPDHGREPVLEAGVRDLPGAPARRIARRIGIHADQDVFSLAGQQPELAFGDGGAERGDDVSIAVLMRHQRVHVALDDHSLLVLSDLATRKVEREQVLLLVEQERVAGIDVLGVDAIF